MTAQTSVRAGAKSEMAIVCSFDVESIRIGKLGWIAIGGSNQDDDSLAGFQRLLEELVPDRSYSGNSLNGTLESEDLLHRTAHQRGVLPKARDCRRVPEECVETVAHQVAGSLMAGDQ